MTKLISVLAALIVVGGCSSASTAQVSPAQLLANPETYNNEHVRTFGHVILGGGMCTLVVPHGRSEASRTAVGVGLSVWLSSNNKLCAQSEKTETCASVSGTFTVVRPRDGKPEAYVITRADVEPTAAGCSAQAPNHSSKRTLKKPRVA